MVVQGIKEFGNLFWDCNLVLITQIIKKKFKTYVCNYKETHFIIMYWMQGEHNFIITFETFIPLQLAFVCTFAICIVVEHFLYSLLLSLSSLILKYLN